MPGKTLRRYGFSRALMVWAWLFVAFTLTLGSTLPTAETRLSSRCDSLLAPSAPSEWVATPVQKSKAAQPFFDTFPVLLPPGSELSVCILPMEAAARRESSSRSFSAGWHSPSLPRPPPSA